MHQLAVEDHTIYQARQVFLAGQVRIHLVYFGQERSHAFTTARGWRLRVGMHGGDAAEDENETAQARAKWTMHAGLYCGLEKRLCPDSDAIEQTKKLTHNFST